MKHQPGCGFRDSIAIDRAETTSSAGIVSLTDQPTTRRQNKSRIKQRFAQPNRVIKNVISETQIRFSCSAEKSRPNKFGEERLNDSFREDAELSPSDFMASLLDRLNKWNPGAGEFEDELTAIVVDVL